VPGGLLGRPSPAERPLEASMPPAAPLRFRPSPSGWRIPLQDWERRSGGPARGRRTLEPEGRGGGYPPRGKLRGRPRGWGSRFRVG
jgi:hypothetical protein